MIMRYNSNMERIDLIGYTCGWGAKRIECRDGPVALKIMDIPAQLRKVGKSAYWSHFSHSDKEDSLLNKRDPLPIIAEYCDNVYQQVTKAVKHDDFPVVLGGDHSMAIGTWSAIANSLKEGQNLGLIWIDAHMDSHTRDTSHSGAYHGMPIS